MQGVVVFATQIRPVFPHLSREMNIVALPQDLTFKVRTTNSGPGYACHTESRICSPNTDAREKSGRFECQTMDVFSRKASPLTNSCRKSPPTVLEAPKNLTFGSIFLPRALTHRLAGALKRRETWSIVRPEPAHLALTRSKPACSTFTGHKPLSRPENPHL